MERVRTGVPSPHGFGGKQAETRGAAGFLLLHSSAFDRIPAAIPFQKPLIVVGREGDLDIPLPDGAVSRQHACVVRQEGEWVLRDLGSRNGTILHGALVRETPLSHGDEVRFGDSVFKFVAEGASDYARYRIDGSHDGPRLSNVPELVGGYQLDRIGVDVERIAPTDLSCVILGETGTGKEVTARAIHRLSGRPGAFQAVNCAAIPGNLLESELFGYRRGAFSGADRDKPGLVKLADRGTLFLDEIGDMPLEAQAKLLRVLQAREVMPLGATSAESVDLRVLCATHRDLELAVREHRFRADLYARLHEHSFRLPPLRERKEDLFLLTRTFVARYAQRPFEIAFPFMVALLHYEWPYNVRELESCIKRAIALADHGVLDEMHLPASVLTAMRSYGEGRGTRDIVASGTMPPEPVTIRRTDTPSEEELRALLQRHQGNVAAVGREYGKERMQVHRWLKRYGIRLEDYRS